MPWFSMCSSFFFIPGSKSTYFLDSGFCSGHSRPGTFSIGGTSFPFTNCPGFSIMTALGYSYLIKAASDGFFSNLPTRFKCLGLKAKNRNWLEQFIRQNMNFQNPLKKQKENIFQKQPEAIPKVQSLTGGHFQEELIVRQVCKHNFICRSIIVL